MLKEIIAWHQRGTRYLIKVDSKDDLLYAGVEGLGLTLMDAKVEDWVVTPRIGKPVEINALWYNALRSMAAFAYRLDRPAETFETLTDLVRRSFSYYCNADGSYCYDVINGPGSEDPSLRPNQLLAASLHYSPLTTQQRRSVVDICVRRFLMSHGLRIYGDPQEARSF